MSNIGIGIGGLQFQQNFQGLHNILGRNFHNCQIDSSENFSLSKVTV